MQKSFAFFLGRSFVPCALAALAGCAATVTRPPSSTSAPQPRIQPSATAAARIVWSVEATDEVKQRSDWDALMTDWAAAMPAAAQAVGAQAQQVDKGSKESADKAATRVVIKINDYRYVSQYMRYAVGVFSGNAHLDVDVDYSEWPTGRTLGAQKYATSSSFIQGMASAMTTKQVQATSAEIVKEVTGKEPVVK